LSGKSPEDGKSESQKDLGKKPVIFAKKQVLGTPGLPDFRTFGLFLIKNFPVWLPVLTFAVLKKTEHGKSFSY